MAKKQQEFRFEPAQGLKSTEEFRVYAGSDFICNVLKVYAGTEWTITNLGSYVDKRFDVVDYQRFPSKEAAAQFAFCLSKTVKQITESHPLPMDLVRFLSDKAKSLSEEERRLEGEFLNDMPF